MREPARPQTSGRGACSPPKCSGSRLRYTIFRQRSPVEDPHVRILCAGVDNGVVPVAHVVLRVGSGIVTIFARMAACPAKHMLEHKM